MNTPTRIDVRAGGEHPLVSLSHGLMQARRLRTTSGAVRVALVAGQALLLAGDEVRIEVHVEGAVLLEVVEPAGTVAYDMRGGQARWDVSISLAEGARLAWHAEPFVVSHGADVTRTTTVDVAADSVASLRETFVLGRSGERGGNLRTTTRAHRGDRAVLLEDLSLAPQDRGGWATLGDHRCLDTITTLGVRLPEAPTTMQLEEPGSVARWIGDDQHLSPLRTLWDATRFREAGALRASAGRPRRLHRAGRTPPVSRRRTAGSRWTAGPG